MEKSLVVIIADLESDRDRIQTAIDVLKQRYDKYLSLIDALEQEPPPTIISNADGYLGPRAAIAVADWVESVTPTPDDLDSLEPPAKNAKNDFPCAEKLTGSTTNATAADRAMDHWAQGLREDGNKPGSGKAAKISKSLTCQTVRVPAPPKPKKETILPKGETLKSLIMGALKEHGQVTSSRLVNLVLEVAPRAASASIRSVISQLRQEGRIVQNDVFLVIPHAELSRMKDLEG